MMCILHQKKTPFVIPSFNDTLSPLCVSYCCTLLVPGLLVAVKVVPPVANKVLLVEHGPVGAQEGVGLAVGLAHVEGLQIYRIIDRYDR